VVVIEPARHQDVQRDRSPASPPLPEHVRPIRDEIRRRVETLIGSLQLEPA